MTKRIFIAGHKGMVGSAIARQLASEADVEIVTRSRVHLPKPDSGCQRSAPGLPTRRRKTPVFRQREFNIRRARGK
jgi:nucleoside-diphosphate-sugar epimerase